MKLSIRVGWVATLENDHATTLWTEQNKAAEFKRGTESLEDDPRSWCPATVTMPSKTSTVFDTTSWPIV